MSTKESLKRKLLEEEEDDDLMLYYYYKKYQRAPINLLFQKRRKEGYFKLLILQHLQDDADMFKKYCRLNKTQFYFILSLIENELKPKSTGTIITAEEKLFITLRFLATGETFVSLSFAYRISDCYISKIVRQVLKLLSKKLPAVTMPALNEKDFIRLAEQFWHQWNVPNLVGAIDGKHIRVKCPRNTGSLCFNYKDYFSIVLLAIVDADCKFIAVDVGAYGKEGDSNIFKESSMGKRIDSNNFNIPGEKCLVGTNIFLPHFLIGDEAFGIDSYMMKPYPRKAAQQDKKKEVFNYRICRARRVSENAFGLLSQIFRIFYTPISINPETCTDLIMTACCLHNLLREEYRQQLGSAFPNQKSEKSLTLNMEPLRRSGGFAKKIGLWMREQLTDYFSSQQGRVSWQDSLTSRKE